MASRMLKHNTRYQAGAALFTLETFADKCMHGMMLFSDDEQNVWIESM
jgi:hypothetical protein